MSLQLRREHAAIGTLVLLAGATEACSSDSSRPGNEASGGGAGSGQAGTTSAGGTQGGSLQAGAPSTGARAGTAGAANGGMGDGGASTPGGAAGGLTEPWTPSFETVVLSTDFVAEGADVGDVDADGTLDLIAGPRWYAGSSFSLGGELVDPVPTFQPTQYSTFFLAFADDLDADGDTDVIAIGDAGGGNDTGNPNAFWYENPGPGQLDRAWAKHVLFQGLVANESPAYVDLVGNARKELVFMTSQALGYAVPGASPDSPWTFHAISSSLFNTPYVHGLGVGDVDGDGLFDVVERDGWWRQTPGQAGAAPTWQRYTADFRLGGRGGAQMYVFDVDGDGDGDVVTSLDAHGYGLAWFEQTREGEELAFTPHEILPRTAAAANVSQLHALAVADILFLGRTCVVRASS
jgi:hypothetical protein